MLDRKIRQHTEKRAHRTVQQSTPLIGLHNTVQQSTGASDWPVQKREFTFRCGCVAHNRAQLAPTSISTGPLRPEPRSPTGRHILTHYKASAPAAAAAAQQQTPSGSIMGIIPSWFAKLVKNRRKKVTKSNGEQYTRNVEYLVPRALELCPCQALLLLLLSAAASTKYTETWERQKTTAL